MASGLDLDMRFAAFDIINCDSGDKYCQVCKFGPSPKIMAVGTIDDADFKQDLKDLDALVKKYGDDKIKAFAVIADAKDGALVTPIGNKDALQAQAKALKEELGLSFPVVLPAPEGEAVNGVFEEYKQDGRYDKTYEKWVGQYTDTEPEPPTISVDEAVDLVKQNAG